MARFAQCCGEAVEAGRPGEDLAERDDFGADQCPRLGLLLGEMRIERLQSGGRSRAAQGQIQRAHRFEPGKTIVADFDQGMLEQGEQRDRGEPFGRGGGDAEQQSPRGGLRQGPPGAVVRGYSPPFEQSRHPRRQASGRA